MRCLCPFKDKWGRESPPVKKKHILMASGLSMTPFSILLPLIFAAPSPFPLSESTLVLFLTPPLIRGRSHITSAARGGRGGKPNVDNCWQGGVWIHRGIDLDFTIHDKQSHITCKLDPNKWKISILSCKQVEVKNCCTKGASGKCWRKLTKGGGGVSQMLTIADGGGSRNPWFWLT